MHENVAIELTEENLRHILTLKTSIWTADFCYGLTKVANPNGENLYFVGGNLNEPFKLNFKHQVFTLRELKKAFTFDENHDSGWFHIIPKPESQKKKL